MKFRLEYKNWKTKQMKLGKFMMSKNQNYQI